MFHWWGGEIRNQPSLDDIISFPGDRDLSEQGREIWVAVVYTSLYLLWYWRNAVVFGNRDVGRSMDPLYEIQIKSLFWMSNGSKDFKIGWSEWLNGHWCS